MRVYGNCCALTVRFDYNTIAKRQFGAVGFVAYALNDAADT